MNWLEWTKMVLKTFPNARITETSNGELIICTEMKIWQDDEGKHIVVDT